VYKDGLYFTQSLRKWITLMVQILFQYGDVGDHRYV
jgi:hypothetical protein